MSSVIHDKISKMMLDYANEIELFVENGKYESFSENKKRQMSKKELWLLIIFSIQNNNYG